MHIERQHTNTHSLHTENYTKTLKRKNLKAVFLLVHNNRQRKSYEKGETNLLIKFFDCTLFPLFSSFLPFSSTFTRLLYQIFISVRKSSSGKITFSISHTEIYFLFHFHLCSARTCYFYVLSHSYNRIFMRFFPLPNAILGFVVCISI